MSTRLSPDGMYYWDGQGWISTLSPDGRFRWNGAAWLPAAGPAYVHVLPPVRTVREPTSWTRPLQIAVIAWYSFTILYGATSPFWMSGLMSQYTQKILQQQQSTYPAGETPPPGFGEMMTTMMTGTLWLVAVVTAVFSLVVIAGAIRRWTWAYWVVLIFLGLGLLSLPTNLVNVATGGGVIGLYGFRLPGYIYWIGLGSGILGAALFVWMLVALVKRGPWGMRKVS